MLESIKKSQNIMPMIVAATLVILTKCPPSLQPSLAKKISCMQLTYGKTYCAKNQQSYLIITVNNIQSVNVNI